MLSPMDSTVNSSGVGAHASGASVDYRKKRIKNVQKLELVRLMKGNFLFIRGKHAVARSEKSRADVWQMITARLNSLGPPVQSAEAWQRRWNDMRSATKSKMAKIQNYGREHGEECPYKLNVVERLIWDTFSVKPEEYMKDLNMKWWREKHQLEPGQPASAVAMAIDSESGSSADVSLTQGFEAASRSNLLESASAVGSSLWQEPMTFGTGREVASLPVLESCVAPGLEPIVAPSSCGVGQDSGYPHAPPGMGYQGTFQEPYTPMHTRNAAEVEQWLHSVSSPGEREDVSVAQDKVSVPSEIVSGCNTLRDLNKMFDLVLKQNEEILNLLRQSCGEHGGT